MKFESLEELVQKRKGYKYLNMDNISPYQKYKYVFRKGKVFTCDDLDDNPQEDCGAGWNLATLSWILKNIDTLKGVKIVEFSIPDDARIIVPQSSTGKYRTNKIRYVKQHELMDLFPKLKIFYQKQKTYKLHNPIVAQEMPDKNKIKKIMSAVQNDVWNDVRKDVQDDLPNAVLKVVWDNVREDVWDDIRDDVQDDLPNAVLRVVRNAILNDVRDNDILDDILKAVQDDVWDDVWDAVRNQSYIAGYRAIVDFLDLDYHHPAFDLVDLGVIVAKSNNQYMVYGKGGKHLGNIDI